MGYLGCVFGSCGEEINAIVACVWNLYFYVIFM